MYWFDSGKYIQYVLPSEIKIARSPKKDVSPLSRRSDPQMGLAFGTRSRGLVRLLGCFLELEFGRSQVTVSLGNFLQYSPRAFVVCVCFFPVKRLGMVLIFELRTLLRLCLVHRHEHVVRQDNEIHRCHDGPCVEHGCRRAVLHSDGRGVPVAIDRCARAPSVRRCSRSTATIQLAAVKAVREPAPEETKTFR